MVSLLVVSLLDVSRGTFRLQVHAADDLTLVHLEAKKNFSWIISLWQPNILISKLLIIFNRWANYASFSVIFHLNSLHCEKFFDGGI